jgi:hypothetical protein
MRTLVVNRKTLNVENRNIGKYTANVGVINDKGMIPVTITCENIHNLPKQGEITFIPENSPFNKKYDYEVLDGFKFIVYIPEYVMMYVTNYATEEENAILEPIDDYFSAYVADATNITLRYMGEIINGGVNIAYDENGVPTNEEDAAARIVSCNKPVSFSGRGFIDVKNDWYIKDGVFNTNIVITEDIYAIEFGIPLERDSEYRLFDTQKKLDEYMDSVKNAILPEIVDNEKQRFIPIYYNEKGKPTQIKEIVFNLHFRDRKNLDLNDGSLRDGWKTTDEQVWNGMTLQNGYLKYNTKGVDDSYSDTLDYLGFTEDDVKFSKNKIKKSFIRCTYYSSKDMLMKEALGYATVFMDIGELYNKYIKISGEKLNIFDNERLDKDLRISSTFKISNNRQNQKSSEGFYLYFYPNEIDDESLQKTIYMKVEFNHAGVGKTVPMMLPRNKNGKVLSSQEKSFPLNFTPEVFDENGNSGIDFDFESYQNAILIPIEISYNMQLGKFVYRFPFATVKDGRVELNLFEPRVNGKV